MSINKKRAGFIVDLFYFLLLAVILWLTLKYAIGLVLPFLTAFAISALVHSIALPLSARIKKLSYPASAALVTTVLFATVGVLIFIITTALIGQFVDFAIYLPDLIRSMVDSLTSAIRSWIDSIPGKTGESILNYFDSTISDTSELVTTLVSLFSQPLMNYVGAVGEFAAKLPAFLITLAITIISTYFISMDFDGIKKMILSVIPKPMRSIATKAKHHFCTVIWKMIKTYSFLMLLTFTELAVGFSIINLKTEHISYPVPLALLIALIDILPVLGVGTVIIPWAVFELITGNTVFAVMLSILYVIIAVVRNFLEPKLVGERFGLHPAITLLAIYAGGKLFGFIGVFALPLTIIVLLRLKEEKSRSTTINKSSAAAGN